MATMKAMVLGLGLAVVLAAIVGLSLALSPSGMQAQGQGASPAAPANVRAANGAEPGQAVVRWDAVAEAAYYRIGWVNMETFRVVEAEDDREWLDVFAFHDVVNRGQTAQTLSDLEPGVQYAFIMASVGHRFGNVAGWSEWAYLTTAAAEVVSCPTNAGTTPGAPGGGGSGAPTPTPVPGATPAATATPTPTPAPAADRDYDTDDDGLIEITSLAQLDVIRHDLDGDGVSVHADYAAAFPNAMEEMGCFAGCSGYELAANLDFDTNGSGRADAGDAYWNEGEGWLPIGDPETDFRFNTIFDGNGHTIANLYIRWTDASHIGLFRAAGDDAVIRNLSLTGVRVSGKDWVGGLVGSNDGSISGSSVAGRVSGFNGIGGLAGFSSGSVSSSHSSVPVAGRSDHVGGLVGSNAGGISDSYATGVVTGRGDNVGGLVGVIVDNSDGSISNSYATGNVAGDGDNVGGLVGYSSGNISNSHATGNVTGESGYVGGLVGYSGSGNITDSHATGNVTGEGRYVGGLAGSSRGAITASYATGSVTGEGFFVGGLAGSSAGAITASYATGNVTGESSITGDSSSVGGLAGYSSGAITASYATGGVTGENSVGGLAGHSSGAITASYATGGVTGENSVGGLVGYFSRGRSSTITASYAIGRVTINSDVGGLVGYGSSDRVTDSYWDTQTTGKPRSGGGTGKTTRELRTPTAATGIYANWDAEWWDFGTARQYPVLKYQGMDVAAQRR